MATEPVLKRARFFIDGQNLFHSVKEAFGYSYPNYDIQALAAKISLQKGWQMTAFIFTRTYPISPIMHSGTISGPQNWP